MMENSKRVNGSDENEKQHIWTQHIHYHELRVDRFASMRISLWHFLFISKI